MERKRKQQKNQRRNKKRNKTDERWTETEHQEQKGKRGKET